MRFFFLLLLLPFSAIAQTDSGYVQFYIYPNYSKIVLDNNTVINSSEKIKIPIGKHKLVISGSKLLTSSDSIDVVKDSTIIIRKIMPNSIEYTAHKKELKKYNNESTATIISMGLVGFSTIYFTYNIYKQSKIQRDEEVRMAEYSQTLYERTSVLSEIEIHKGNFERNKENYYKYNRQMYYAIPVGVVGSYLTYKIYKFYKSKKKPQFIELSGLNYFMDINNINTISMSFKF